MGLGMRQRADVSDWSAAMEAAGPPRTPASRLRSALVVGLIGSLLVAGVVMVASTGGEEAAGGPARTDSGAQALEAAAAAGLPDGYEIANGGVVGPDGSYAALPPLDVDAVPDRAADDRPEPPAAPQPPDPPAGLATLHATAALEWTGRPLFFRCYSGSTELDATTIAGVTDALCFNATTARPDEWALEFEFSADQTVRSVTLSSFGYQGGYAAKTLARDFATLPYAGADPVTVAHTLRRHIDARTFGQFDVGGARWTVAFDEFDGSISITVS